MAPKKSGSGGDLLDIEKQVRFVLQAQQGGERRDTTCMVGIDKQQNE